MVRKALSAEITGGEVKRNLLMLFFMFAGVIAVSWGFFGNLHIAAAFLSGVIVLHFFGNFPVGRTVLGSLPAGLAGAATELFSPSEWDTVTVPVVILIVLLVAI